MNGRKAIVVLFAVLSVLSLPFVLGVPPLEETDNTSDEDVAENRDETTPPATPNDRPLTGDEDTAENGTETIGYGDQTDTDLSEGTTDYAENVTGNWFVKKPQSAWSVTSYEGYDLYVPSYTHGEGDTGDGIFVSDYDNDGDQDILGLVGFTPLLFENNGGGFEKPQTLPVQVNVTSALFFDYDNDGWEDLYLMSDEGSVFLENEEGNFQRKKVGLGVSYDSVRGASAADYNKDGCLDVFVVQANDWEDARPAGFGTRNITVDEDNGNRNMLFKGNCNSFTEVTEAAGIHGTAWSLATSFVDLTNDGYPDIHVANDFNNGVMYINNGDGTFERRILPEYTNRNGMSSEVADVNGDGYLDILITNIHVKSLDLTERDFAGRTRGNNLLINDGDGTFRDMAAEYGVRNGTWGWAAEFSDFNNNMRRDLYHSTYSGYGHKSAFFRRTAEGFEAVKNDTALGGLGKGETFAPVSVDYNGDGYLDIAEARIYTSGNGFLLYENKKEGKNWLKVSVNPKSNKTTIGTRVRVTAGNTTQLGVKNSKSDYFSQSSRVLHFGLGDEQEADVTVRFPDGTERRYSNVDANQTISVPYE